ncbi:MAG: endonuclease III [Candidatus Hydrogenedentota bacterium]
MPKFKLTIGANRERAREVFALLDAEYPEAECSLDHANPLELMVATILSAQCTDVRVNKISPALFKAFKTPADYADKPIEELKKYIQSCGFYHNKAKNIKAAGKRIVELHGGDVPQTLEELVALAGVGRKTANVILGTCFNTPGVVVDTHCGRITRRLGFTRNTDPVKVEHDLMNIWEHEHWSLFSHFMVFHGRAVCMSRSPECSRCCVKDLCPFPETREGKKISR